MRSPHASALWNNVTRNRYVWGALALCVVLLFGALYVPGVARVLGVQPPSAEGWGIIALMSLVPLGVGQVVLLLRKYLGASREKRTALG